MHGTEERKEGCWVERRGEEWRGEERRGEERLLGGWVKGRMMGLRSVELCGMRTAVGGRTWRTRFGVAQGRRASRRMGVAGSGSGSGTWPASTPVAPIELPEGPWEVVEGGGVTSARGFRAMGTVAGLKASGLPDLGVVVCEGEGATAAGVFTLNQVCAPPVDVCKRVVASGRRVRAVVANSGQANAATGAAGLADAERMCGEAARAVGCEAGEVLVCSTGVIGQRVKMEPLVAALPGLVGGAAADAEAGARFARAIMTTDLVLKSCAVRVDVAGKVVTIGGCSKGSGMIHPNMATMLGFVTCDAAVDPALWRRMTSAAADASFNQISVDGDTSTNDTLLCLASGAAWGAGEAPVSDGAGEDAARLQAGLTAVCQALAKAIARDGEGATCMIECNVRGTATDADARKVAKSVICSSLFKAAVYGSDPNWGRIAAAAGYAGVPFDQAHLRIQMGEHVLMDKGQPLAFDAKAASAYIRAAKDAPAGTVVVDIDLTSSGVGTGTGTAFGCDLSYDYVKINAEYTT